LDRAHEGFGLHDVLTVSGTKDDVGLHDRRSRRLVDDRASVKQCCYPTEV
jgi:hypothetical protein